MSDVVVAAAAPQPASARRSGLKFAFSLVLGSPEAQLG